LPRIFVERDRYAFRDLLNHGLSSGQALVIVIIKLSG
jgi:hypothetical protein